MSIDRVLDKLKPAKKRGEITAWIRIEAQPGEYRDYPSGLSPRLRQTLVSKDIKWLYSHQAEAFEQARQGRHLVVVTPTASGKTLCYNLPVLEALLQDPEQRALYLFPTKALAQDQMAELHQLEQLLDLPIGVHTYDGDTPGDVRRKVRDQARIILTNPDMLHSAVLPHHPLWAKLFRNLRFVVVDELHTYRGVFGSHVANVFRRLKRVARFYGSELQFICASATIANPAELASNLLEEEVFQIDRSGAPRAAKDLIFYNPPLVNSELGLRRSALTVARRLAESFLRAKIQTLLFATSRISVEVLLRYLQKAIDSHPGKPPQVRGYRGGYLPKTRRAIERQLRKKEILGVVSTNALELGIDIGTLEACILAGYPGSVASTWQQVGRSGRRLGRSVAILVARNLPLDQFMVRCPEYFLDQSPEHGLIHPDNLQILVSHVKCAAFELPFRRDERFGDESLEEILSFLDEQGTLTRQQGAWFWSDEGYPASEVSLRNLAEENFVVFDRDQANQAIAEVDFDSAPELIYEQAIYLCEGRQYQIERLDYDGRKAYARRVNVDYFTEAISYSGLRVLKSDDQTTSHNCAVEHGEIHLVKKFPGFKKVRFDSWENLGYGKIQLPIHELHTTSYWFTAPENLLLKQVLTRQQVVVGFLGLAYALHHIATMLLMCDFRDLGRSVGSRSTRWFALSGPEGLGCYSAEGDQDPIDLEFLDSFDPTIFLYDNCPGGIGFSEKLFESHELLLAQAGQLISRCGCSSGCPSCVGPINEAGVTIKQIVLKILKGLMPDRSAAVTVH